MNTDDLLNEIDHLFAQVPLHAQSSMRTDDLYEAFCAGLVLQAARNRGMHVSWHYVDGSSAPEVRLRAAPGEIYTPDFTYALLSITGSAVFELHVGIKVRGIGATNECDVAVLHAGVASMRRQAFVTPGWNDATAVLEAKAYEKTAIRLSLARQAVGLAVDLHHRRVALVASRPIEPSAYDLAQCWLVLGAWPSVVPNSQEADDLVSALTIALA
jgi:hypothetical protein